MNKPFAWTSLTKYPEKEDLVKLEAFFKDVYPKGYLEIVNEFGLGVLNDIHYIFSPNQIINESISSRKSNRFEYWSDAIASFTPQESDVYDHFVLGHDGSDIEFIGFPRLEGAIFAYDGDYRTFYELPEGLLNTLNWQDVDGNQVYFDGFDGSNVFQAEIDLYSITSVNLKKNSNYSSLVEYLENVYASGDQSLYRIQRSQNTQDIYSKKYNSRVQYLQTQTEESLLSHVIITYEKQWENFSHETIEKINDLFATK